MSGTRKTKRSGIAGNNAEPASVKPLKASRLQRINKWARNLLGGALLFAACDTTNITKVYCPSPDGGAQVTDARQQEDASVQTDAACVPDYTPLTCSDNTKTGKLLKPGEHLSFGPLNIKLIDVEENQCRNEAIATITDSCGNEVTSSWFKIKDGKFWYIGSANTVYIIEIKAENIVKGDTPEATGAYFTVSIPCNGYAPDGWHVVVSGNADQGTALNADGFRVRLADISVSNICPESALLHIVDLNGNILKKMNLEEVDPEAIVVGGYNNYNLIMVTKIYAGFTFGEKSADIEVWKAVPGI